MQSCTNVYHRVDFAIRISLCLLPGQAVQHACQNDMDLDRALQLRQSAQQDIKCADVELVREALDDALHEVLLRNVVLALNDLLHHPR